MKNKGIDLAIRIILVWLGTAGILNTVLSAASLSVSDFGILFVAGATGTMLICLVSIPPAGKFFLRLGAAIFGVFSVLFSFMIYKGMRLVINDCLKAMEQPNDIVLPRLAVRVEEDAVSSFETAAMIFAAVVVAVVVSIVIMYAHSMLAALLSILPGMIIFIGFSVIPDIFSFILCISYVFGVAALHQERKSSEAAAMVIGISIAAAFGSLIFVPMNGYSHFPLFEKWGSAIQGSWFGDGMQLNGTPVELKSAINTGRLGEIDTLQYQNEPVLQLSAEDVGVNQYIGEFYGADYRNNRWIAENEEDLTKRLIDLLDSSYALQRYIDGGTGNYKTMVQRYYQSVDYYGQAKSSSTYRERYQVNSACYENIRNLVSGNYYNPATEVAVQGYAKVEAALREKVYTAYTRVDDETRNIVTMLLGDVSVKTPEQKLNYIKYVKDFLANNYSYTKSPGSVPENTDFVKYFLLDSKEGYCTYFATAAVMIYRAAGIPARYVEGYVVEREQLTSGSAVRQIKSRNIDTGEDKADSTTYVDVYTVEVMDNQAHAWVEIYMDGYGWVTVEATPPAGEGGVFGTGSRFAPVDSLVQENTLAPEEQQTTQQTETATEQGEISSEQESILESLWANENETSSRAALEPADTPHRISFKKVSILAVLMILVLLVLTGIVRFLRLDGQRKKALRSGNVYDVYQYLEKLLYYAGYERPAAMAYEEYTDYLENENDVFRKCHLKKHFSMLMSLRFSGNEQQPEPSAAVAFRKDTEQVRRGLFSQMSFGRRLLLRFVWGL